MPFPLHFLQNGRIMIVTRKRNSFGGKLSWLSRSLMLALLAALALLNAPWKLSSKATASSISTLTSASNAALALMPAPLALPNRLNGICALWAHIQKEENQAVYQSGFSFSLCLPAHFLCQHHQTLIHFSPCAERR